MLSAILRSSMGRIGITVLICCTMLSPCLPTQKAQADEGASAPVPYAYIDELIHLYDEASAFPGEKVNVKYHRYTFENGYTTLAPTWLGYEGLATRAIYDRYGNLKGITISDLTHYRANYSFY